MKTQTIHYETNAQMMHGVEQLSDDGWILGKVLRGDGETSIADFYKHDSKPAADPSGEAS